jgi:hypothetical protein
MRSSVDLESVHRFCTNNRELLAHSDRAGCFYCQAIIEAHEIEDWVDGAQVETGELTDGVTALCPRCGIDAVLPSAAPIKLDAPLLSEMHRSWFERSRTL